MIIGGTSASTTFEGEGFDRKGIRNLTLKTPRVDERGELFLHYRLGKAAAQRVAA